MNNFVYSSITEKHFGTDSISKIGKLTIKYGRKVLLVYGRSSIKKSGLYDRVVELLKKQNCEIFEVSGIRSNPEISKIYEGIEIAKNGNVNVVLAIGGGSVWDSAKAISAGVRYNGDVWDLYSGKSFKDALPIGGIITMPATSSESNPISVISNDKLKLKRSFYNHKVTPKFVLIDPTLGYTIPDNSLRYGAFDIISHLLEGYFDRSSSEFLDLVSLNAIKRVFTILPQLLTNRENYDLMSEYFYLGNFAHEGILYAGRAGGDWACHKIEHSLSAFNPNIIHGEGLAIVFPAWMRYVYKFESNKFINLFNFLYGVNDFYKGLSLFKKHIYSLGIKTNLAEKEYPKQQLKEFIIKDLSYYKAVGQIKVLDKDDIGAIVDNFYID